MMDILHLIATAVGHVWILCMILRIPPVIRESRDFLECLRHIKYRRSPRWFTVYRYALPNLLTSPVLLLMNGRYALRALPGEDIYQAMLYTVDAYGGGLTGDTEAEEEQTEVEKCLSNGIVPYNRQLSDKSVEDVFEEVVEARRELGLELPPTDHKKLH